MATFDEIKRKAAEAAGIIADKTSIVARITRLTAENTASRESLKKSYRNIGKIYCDMFGDEPAPELAQLVEEVGVLSSLIEDKNEEIEELKAMLTTKSWEPCDCGCCECKDAECGDECCCGEKADESCCCEGNTEEPCCCESAEEEKPTTPNYTHF